LKALVSMTCYEYKGKVVPVLNQVPPHEGVPYA